MAFAPQVGSGTLVGSWVDDVQISATLGVGGSKALQYFDTAAGYTQIQYTSSAALKSGQAQLSWDFLGEPGTNGALDYTRPCLNMTLLSGSTTVGTALFYFNYILGVSDAVTYFHSTGLSGQNAGSFYHAAANLDLTNTTMTWSLSSGSTVLCTIAVEALRPAMIQGQGLRGLFSKPARPPGEGQTSAVAFTMTGRISLSTTCRCRVLFPSLRRWRVWLPDF